MDHSRIDQRSLAFGEAIAARIVGHPEFIEQARATLARWMRNCAPNTRATLEEWNAALEGPGEEIIGILTGTDERSTRLRQSNPFTCVLTEQERNQIIQQFHDKAAT